MIDLGLFRSRVFSGGLLSMGMWAFGVFGIYFFTAIYLQSALGFSPTEAGAGFVPMALLMAGRRGLLAGAGPAHRHRPVGRRRAGADGRRHGRAVEHRPRVDLPRPAAVVPRLRRGRRDAGPADRRDHRRGPRRAGRDRLRGRSTSPARSSDLLGITILGAILNARQTAPTMPAFLDAYQFTLLIAAAIVLVRVPIALYALREGRTAEAVTEEDRDPALV